MSSGYDMPGILGRGLTTSLVNDGGVTRWVPTLSNVGSSRVNITNHDQPVGERLYRDLTKEILRDLTSQSYNRKRRYITAYMKRWYLHGRFLRGMEVGRNLSPTSPPNVGTRPVTHIAPECWNSSYCRTAEPSMVFEHFWTETGQQFLYQFKVIVG